MSFFNGDVKTSSLIVRGGGSDPGTLILFDDDNSANVNLKAPTTVQSSYTLVLPADVGGASQILSTNGSGVLDWIDGAGAGVAADDIEAGPTNVEITTSSGNITSNVASGDSVIFQNNSSDVLTISATNIQQPASGWLIFENPNTAIYSSTDGRMDIIGEDEVQVDGNVYLEASTGINLETPLLTTPVFDTTQALVFRDSNNYIYSPDESNIQMITVNTLNLYGNESVKFRTNTSNTVVFDVGGGESSDQIRISYDNSIVYMNMTSTNQSSGIGFRNDSGQLEFKPNTNQNWQPVIGFPKSITTVNTNTVVSIPSGTTAINIKAVAAGGGGGGTNSASSPDSLGTGGGGGGGQFCDIYIDNSNIGANTAVYIQIGLGGAGSSENSNANGANGGNTIITLVESGSNSGPLVTLHGGLGGVNDFTGSAGGLGGYVESGFSNCIGYVVPGCNGEAGYTIDDLINKLTQGRGGRSRLGPGGRMHVLGNTESGTDGIQGGGGCGAHDEANYDAKNGGNGFAVVMFY